MTPAMAAGITDRVWTLEDIVQMAEIKKGKKFDISN
jgi:hypothetical protein